MKLRFWQKDATKDETIIEVKDISSTNSIFIDSTIYVKAQTNEKALELYDKLEERKKK